MRSAAETTGQNDILTRAGAPLGGDGLRTPDLYAVDANRELRVLTVGRDFRDIQDQRVAVTWRRRWRQER